MTSKSSGTDVPHVSVLLAEVIEVVAPKDGGIYVDGTFGAGGYSKALLEAADCKVVGIDQDPRAHELGQALLENYHGRLTLIRGKFGDLEALLKDRGVAQVDGIVLDLGVSSMQLDETERGFSFSRDADLDMRMSGEGQTAADLINDLSEEDLANVLYIYGEERKSRSIAKAIVTARTEKKIERTLELASIVERVIGRKPSDRTHPATKSFQAIRIYLNDEVGELRRVLAASEKVLCPTGRLAVVSFQSIDDRIVKRFMAARSGRIASQSRHLPETESNMPQPTYRLLRSRATKASEQERTRNPRARSARLRAAERTTAAPWSEAHNRSVDWYDSGEKINHG